MHGAGAIACLLSTFLLAEPPEPRRSPLVQTLLDAPAKADGDHQSPFFVALTKLASRNGVEPSEYTVYRSGKARSGEHGTRLDNGQARLLGSGVLVDLHSTPITRPGVTARQLLLF